MTRKLLAVLLMCGTALAAPAAFQDPAGGAGMPAQCIALVLPRVQGVQGNATTVGTSVRELFASFLRGPSMQALLLEARLPAHAVEEAKQKGCSTVLTVTLNYKRHGGGSKVLGRVIGQAGASAAWGIPGGSVGSAVTRGATVAATQAIADIASSTRARDEVKMEYRLSSVDGKTLLGPTSDTAKAQSDGEDLLTPLVERAAEAVVGAASTPSKGR